MSRLPHLQPMQRSILNEISEGYTNRVIAERVGLQERTVKTYISHIYDILCSERDFKGMVEPRVLVAIWWREVGKAAYAQLEEEKQEPVILGPYSDIGTQHLNVMFGERRAG